MNNRRSLSNCAAFTMAEILLSLTIIGVVAAITLPSLTGNINERTWNTQRKALYARFSQAIALMPALNGYGTLSEDESGSVTQDTAAETFVTSGLSKVLKINNICDSDHLADCGIPDKIIQINGTEAFSTFPKSLLDFNANFSLYIDDTAFGTIYSYSQINTKAAAFETVNGESIGVFYNPSCISDKTIYATGGRGITPHNAYAQARMCANFVYDLNGTKGPNTVGKDIGFITLFYATDPIVVAPMPRRPFTNSGKLEDAMKYCRSNFDDARLPNIEEIMAVFVNQVLVSDIFLAGRSTTRASESSKWVLRSSGSFTSVTDSSNREYFCITR